MPDFPAEAWIGLACGLIFGFVFVKALCEAGQEEPEPEVDEEDIEHLDFPVPPARQNEEIEA